MDRKNKEFIKSRWVYIYKHGGELAIFNSKNLEIFFVDQETINLLNYFKEPHNIDEAFIFFKDKSQKIKKIVNNLMKTKFIVPIDLNETKKLEKEVVLERKKKESLLGDSLRLNSLRIVLTEICNLDCSYCFVHNRDLRKEDDISFSTIKKSIDLLVSLNKGGDIEVQFFGGEPLLKWDLIVETVDYVEKIINQGKIKNVYYGITTNGILINQKKSKFFKDNNFLVSVSLDGWESLNDLNRHYSNKKGSFDKIINGLEVLKNNDNEIGILVTPDKNNIKLLAKACEYIIDKLNFKFITINTPQPIKGNWEIDGILFSQQIKKCFKIAKKHKAIINSFGTRVIYALNDKQPLIFSCSKFGGNFTATLTPKKKLSSCIVNWYYKDSLTSLEKFKYQGNFTKWKFAQPYFLKKCLNCPAMNVCGGPCPLEIYELKKFSKSIDYERCKFFRDFLEWSIWFKG